MAASNLDTSELRQLFEAHGLKEYVGLKCGVWRDGSTITLPIVVVNGSDAGPVYVATAGVHGDETAGVDAIRQIAARLDIAAMRGAFVGVFAANLPAFLHGERVDSAEIPAGRNDMAALWRSAKPNGSLTERIACLIRDHIVARCDLYVDLHAAQLGYDRVPTAIVAGEGHDLPESVRKQTDRQAIVCDLEYVYRAEAPTKGKAAVPSFPFDDNKPSIELEVGPALTSAGSELMVKGVWNLLVDAGIVGGSVERTRPATYIGRLLGMRADSGGIWHPISTTGTRVSKGDLMGQILNLNSKVTEEVRAPCDAIVIRALTSTTVMTGMMTYGLGIPTSS